MGEDRRGKEMDVAIKRRKPSLSLQEKLQLIAQNAPQSRSREGKILLSRNNPDDVEWMEEDKHRDK